MKKPSNSKTQNDNGIRKIFILIHRYVDLVMAVFLVVAGLTGSLITFYHELDTAINPSLMKAEPLRRLNQLFVLY